MALAAGALLILGIGAWVLANRQAGPGGGAANQLTPVSTLQAADYHSLAVSPEDADLVWFGSHSGIQESTDGGRTWRALDGISGDAMSMARPPAEPSRAYIAGHDIFKRSTDGGRIWEDVKTDLPGTDIHGFAADPTDADHVYAIVAGQGMFESRDGGDKWQPFVAQPPGALGGLAIVPGEPPTLYVVTQLGVMRTKSPGNSWHVAKLGLPERSEGAAAILPMPGKPEQLYAGTGKGLYFSNDGGVSWRAAGLSGRPVVALAASQSGPLRVYALSSNGSFFRLEGEALSQ